MRRAASLMHCQETKLARSINEFRKDVQTSNKALSQAARRLLNTWKAALQIGPRTTADTHAARSPASTAAHRRDVSTAGAPESVLPVPLFNPAPLAEPGVRAQVHAAHSPQQDVREPFTPARRIDGIDGCASPDGSWCDACTGGPPLTAQVLVAVVDPGGGQCGAGARHPAVCRVVAQIALL